MESRYDVGCNETWSCSGDSCSPGYEKINSSRRGEGNHERTQSVQRTGRIGRGLSGRTYEELRGILIINLAQFDLHRKVPRSHLGGGS